MKDRLEERLRRLNIGSPDPALRGRVLRAAGAALPGAAELSTGQGWLAGWRVEALLTTGIVAAVVLLLLLPSPADRSVTMPRINEAAVESIVEELQLDKDLEAHFRTRVHFAERKLAAMRRAGHGHRPYDIEAF